MKKTHNPKAHERLKKYRKKEELTNGLQLNTTN